MATYPPVDPAYANAMGWSQRDLARLDSPLEQIKPAGPLQRPGVQALLEILKSEPGLPAEFTQAILGQLGAGIQGRRDQRQARGDARQQTRTDFRTQLAGAAQTMPLAGAQAFASTMFPGLADKPIAENTLNSLYSGATAPESLSPINPAASVTGTTGLSEEEKATLASKLVASVSNTDGTLTLDPNNAGALYAMRQQAKTMAIAAGMPPEDVQAAEDLAEQIFAQLSGRGISAVNQMGRPGYTWPTR